jgi:hypothetical protein
MGDTQVTMLVQYKKLVIHDDWMIQGHPHGLEASISVA